MQLLTTYYLPNNLVQFIKQKANQNVDIIAWQVIPIGWAITNFAMISRSTIQLLLRKLHFPIK